MNTARAEKLLDRIAAVVGPGVYEAPDFTQIRDLAARGLAAPMTITPAEIQELAQVLVLFLPKTLSGPMPARPLAAAPQPL